MIKAVPLRRNNGVTEGVGLPPGAPYLPAVVLSLSPIVSAAKLYTASVPVPVAQIVRAAALMAGVAAAFAARLALLPGCHRRKGSALAAATLAAGDVPAEPHFPACVVGGRSEWDDSPAAYESGRLFVVCAVAASEASGLASAARRAAGRRRRRSICHTSRAANT